MLVDKFGRSGNKRIQYIPPGVGTSVGVTMSQINNTLLRRDGSNTVTGEWRHKYEQTCSH